MDYLSTLAAKPKALLEELGWHRYQMFVVFNVCAGWALSLLWLVIISVVMRETKQLSLAEKGLLGAAEELGKFLGSFYFGYLSDNYGRSYAFARAGVWMLVGAALLPLCPYEHLLYYPIIIIGFGLGGNATVGVTLILESVPRRQHWASTLSGGCWSIGGTISGLFAFLIFYYEWDVIEIWRMMAIFGLVSTLIVLLRFKIFETPAFLFNKKQFVEYYDTIDKVVAFSGDFRASSKRSLLADARMINLTYSLTANKAAYSTLLTPKHIWKTLAYTLVYFTAGFSHAGYTFLVPAFIQVSTKQELYAVVCSQQLMGLPSIILASLFIDKFFGKLKAISASFAMASIALLALLYAEADYLVKSTQIILCTGQVVLLISIGFSALFAVTPESYPVSLRGVASGWTASMSRLAGVVSPIAASSAISWFGSVKAAVLLYVVSCMLCGVFSLLIPPLKPLKKSK